MLVGLFILKAPYPVLMAIVIAVLDLLPIIGVGFVLIPWGVWSIMIGNVPFGIGILVLFVFQTIIREIIEPKIVGKNLGTHPILTLIFIYVGYSLFGIIGLILVPVLTVLVNIAFGKKNSSEVTEHTLEEGNNA
jgi:predicted PurR-regulated permease PerM